MFLHFIFLKASTSLQLYVITFNLELLRRQKIILTKKEFMLNLLHHSKCFFGTSREESEGKIEQKKDFGLLMILKGNAAEEKIFSKTKSRDSSLKGTRLLGVTSCFVLMGDQILKFKRIFKYNGTLNSTCAQHS